MRLTAEMFIEELEACGCHIVFTYNGKDCGVDPYLESTDSYDLWYGDKFTTLYGIDKLLDTPFFDGKSFREICEYADFDVGEIT